MLVKAYHKMIVMILLIVGGIMMDIGMIMESIIMRVGNVPLMMMMVIIIMVI